MTTQPLITNLFRHPQLIQAVAQMIHDEFWVDVKYGVSVADLVGHLQTANTSNHIPLSLIALVDGELAECVNLIENDDTQRAHLRPWLAAMVVRADLRGQGIGSALIKALLDEVRALGSRPFTSAPTGLGFMSDLVR